MPHSQLIEIAQKVFENYKIYKKLEQKDNQGVRIALWEKNF